MPTRATLGALAAVVLIVCRLVQGFATGGEYGTSATYMSEAATRERRGFFSSFQYVTLIGGHVLAQLTLLIMFGFLSEDQVRDWGWRIPFAIGGLGALVVLWMRRTMDESLSAEQLAEGKSSSAGSLRALFTQYRKPFLLCFLITLGGTVAFYTYSVNAPAIIKSTYKDDALTATWINLLSLIFLMALQPFGGMLSDRIGRKPMLVGFGVGGVVYTYFLITYLPADEERRALLPAGRRGLRHPHRVHVDQRDREGRALPVPHPGVGRRVGLRPGQLDIRRHLAGDLRGVEGGGPGAALHRVRHRVHRRSRWRSTSSRCTTRPRPPLDAEQGFAYQSVR